MQAIKCIVVGDGAVGKTSMLMAFSSNSFPETYVPTVFDNYNTPVVVDGVAYNMGLWDTAGQEDYNRLRVMCYPQTDVFIICFAVCDVSSFLNVKQRWIPELHSYCPGTPYLLVGTKADIRHDEKTLAELANRNEKAVSVDQARKLAHEVKATMYLECSALTQTGLRKIFEEAARSVIKKQQADAASAASSESGSSHPSDGLASSNSLRKRKHGCLLI